MENIESLIELFQQFGGKFENVVLGHSKESGFYCYTLDSNQHTVISCPSNLLVDTVDVDVSEDGLYITNPEKYGNNMEFLGKYFKFHYNKTMLNQYSEMKRQINSLSSRDLSLISNIIPSNLYELGEYSGLEYEKKQMLDCHKITNDGKTMIMPFVTFLNHDKNGQLYDIRNDAISVSGKFSSEVFAKYNNGDALMIGGAYGFVTGAKFAYSIPGSFTMPNGTRVIINRSPISRSINTNKGHRVPLIEMKRGIVTISWFPLHYEGAPMHPAMVAKMVASETNLSAERLLLNVIRLNLNALTPAAFQLKESENSFARYVGAVAQRQLEIIAGSKV